jgi:hypothetical protein
VRARRRADDRGLRPFALTGFPLDDLWHRIFGQDVTLWGPTHLMLIGGGSLATLGGMVLMSEAIATLGRDPERERSRPLVFHLRRGLLVGGFLVALSTFQGEFDFGVPQFRLVLHPILIMLAAEVGLVTARIYLGRGGGAARRARFRADPRTHRDHGGRGLGPDDAAFSAVSGGGAARRGRLPSCPGHSPVATGAFAGVLLGTLGLAAEWGWTNVLVPIPWTSALLPEAAVAGLVTAVAAGAVGGFIGGALTGQTACPPASGRSTSERRC